MADIKLKVRAIMVKIYWFLNVIVLPIVAIYVCYVNFTTGQWENALLIALLSIFSIGNYLKAYGEPIERASENAYQDGFINKALKRCENLELQIQQINQKLEDLDE